MASYEDDGEDMEMVASGAMSSYERSKARAAASPEVSPTGRSTERSLLDCSFCRLRPERCEASSLRCGCRLTHAPTHPNAERRRQLLDHRHGHRLRQAQSPRGGSSAATPWPPPRPRHPPPPPPPHTPPPPHQRPLALTLLQGVDTRAISDLCEALEDQQIDGQDLLSLDEQKVRSRVVLWPRRRRSMGSDAPASAPAQPRTPSTDTTTTSIEHPRPGPTLTPT